MPRWRRIARAGQAEVSGKSIRRCRHGSASCLRPASVLTGQCLCLCQSLKNSTLTPIWTRAGAANCRGIGRIRLAFPETSRFEQRQDRPEAPEGCGQEPVLSS